ncbi:unnamed protein product [Bursaphelenchus xylophilus]|uniref:(pine wood nematode) hypothetical protein n=1 Tax=Bursaphelenchus xylophilus TaxID=6326 RepID=A0A1I7RNT7_BURXY|nr:unnamed protein product [Bursaphelenchus xylophilus]CAG9124280.1 unnamed protein product [Bursaphelenchus xylophilus]
MEGSSSPRSVRPSFAENIYGAGNPSTEESKARIQMGSQICESALAQRRAAYLPKLRELSNAGNVSMDQTHARSEMGDIAFVYADCDSFANELSELYSYSEVDEFGATLSLYQNYAEERGISPIWIFNEKDEMKSVFSDIIQRLESANLNMRLDACGILLYILQGAYGDFKKPYNESVQALMDEARSHVSYIDETDYVEQFCLIQAAANCYMAYECGVFRALCQLFMTEFNEVNLVDQTASERGHSSLSQYSSHRSMSSMDGESRTKKVYTLSDNEILRFLISSMYHMVESIRRKDVLQKVIHVSDYSVARLENLQHNFLIELGEPLEGLSKPLFVYLLDVVPPFVRGSCPKYPIKKVLLLAWKIILATLGDAETLRTRKQEMRESFGLSRVEDTVQVAATLKASNFSAEEGLGDGRRLGQMGVIAKRSRPSTVRAFKRQEGITSANLSTDEPSSDLKEDEPPVTPIETDGEESVKKNEYFSKPISAVMLQKNEEGEVEQKPLLEGPQDSLTNQRGDQTPTASSPVPSCLPWTSKVRKADLENFIQTARHKFFGYKLPGDVETLFGLPQPVQQSVEAFKRHLYKSLGECQMEEDARLNKYPFSRKEHVEDNPTERLYIGMLPNLSNYALSLLKVLLVAIPSSKAKNDGALILSDVLTRSGDATDMLSNSLNLDVSVNSSNLLEEAVRMAIDINRHKEIVVKATTAIIVYLLKFFRLNHIYQYENFSQQLVLSNCLPLVLKFLDQNMVRYLQSKNELTPLCYPKVVVYYVQNGNKWPELNADNVDDSRSENQHYFLWRNVFSSVNLLRVLNKLIKNKQSRTMMLVVFKSAPILRRCLKVRSGIFQLYTLKLLKMQARYLGRQWRKNNMEVISAVYMKVRHRLNDDWAFANETRCKTWDFQMEERELKLNVERFNSRRYSHIYPELASNNSENLTCDDFDPKEFEPVDDSIQNLLSEEFEFTPFFKRNYGKWLDEAVFNEPFNWDALLTQTSSIC